MQHLKEMGYFTIFTSILLGMAKRSKTEKNLLDLLLLFAYFAAKPSETQSLLLVLHSGIISGSLGDAGDLTWVSRYIALPAMLSFWPPNYPILSFFMSEKRNVPPNS